MYTSIVFAATTLVALANAQSTNTITGAPSATPTSVSPNQSSAISQALVSYAGSLLQERAIRQLGIGLALNGVAINSDNLAALNPVPTTGSVDWLSFANNPPSITATPTWLVTMPAETKSSVSSIQASALDRAVNIVRAQLGEPSTTIPAFAAATSASPTGTNAAVPARMGAAEGLLGAAAMGVGLVAAAL